MILAYWITRLYPVLLILYRSTNQELGGKSKVVICHPLQPLDVLLELLLLLMFKASYVDPILLLAHS